MLITEPSKRLEMLTYNVWRDFPLDFKNKSLKSAARITPVW